MTADIHGTVRLWDAAGDRPARVLRAHDGAFSPDDRLVVTAGSDRVANVWDVQTGRRVLALAGHTAGVSSARFTPDGRRIVTAGDTTTRVWDARSGRLLGIEYEHADVVADVAAHGDLIASGGRDRTVRLYRCRTCVPVAELPGLAAQRVTRSLTPLERQRFLDEK